MIIEKRREILKELITLDETFREVNRAFHNAKDQKSQLKQIYREYNDLYEQFIFMLSQLKATDEMYENIERDQKSGWIVDENARVHKLKLATNFEYQHSRITGEIVESLRVLLRGLKIEGLSKEQKEILNKERDSALAITGSVENNRNVIDIVKPYLDVLLTIIKIITTFTMPGGA